MYFAIGAALFWGKSHGICFALLSIRSDGTVGIDEPPFSFESVIFELTSIKSAIFILEFNNLLCQCNLA